MIVTCIDVFTLTIFKAIAFSKSWPLFAFVGLGYFVKEIIAFLVKKISTIEPFLTV